MGHYISSQVFIKVKPELRQQLEKVYGINRITKDYDEIEKYVSELYSNLNIKIAYDFYNSFFLGFNSLGDFSYVDLLSEKYGNSYCVDSGLLVIHFSSKISKHEEAIKNFIGVVAEAYIVVSLCEEDLGHVYCQNSNQFDFEIKNDVKEFLKFKSYNKNIDIKLNNDSEQHIRFSSGL